MSGLGSELLAGADRVAEAAGGRAGVSVRPVAAMEDLRRVSRLFESVWGRNTEGVPVGSEVMRSLVHAGGCVTGAFTGSDALVGAAVLTPDARPGTAYSLIAGVAPGGADRGVGYAVKLGQRGWALSHGFEHMVWTFDPLVGRNARFNLTKLGAVAAEYENGFYGRMTDELNGVDDSDRLVVTWSLASRKAVDAAAGTTDEPPGPPEEAQPVVDGPDGAPLVVRDRTARWVRVPGDIVSLRRHDAAAASRWRHAVRAAFTSAFGDGLVAMQMSRDGWYRLAPGDER